MVSRETSCGGSDVTTERMFAWCAGWVMLTRRLAPLSLDVFALLAETNLGANASALQPVTAKGLLGDCVAPNVEVSAELVSSPPQYVGL